MRALLLQSLYVVLGMAVCETWERGTITMERHPKYKAMTEDLDSLKESS